MKRSVNEINADIEAADKELVGIHTDLEAARRKGFDTSPIHLRASRFEQDLDELKAELRQRMASDAAGPIASSAAMVDYPKAVSIVNDLRGGSVLKESLYRTDIAKTTLVDDALVKLKTMDDKILGKIPGSGVKTIKDRDGDECIKVSDYYFLLNK